jgi:hypothetical protein
MAIMTTPTSLRRPVPRSSTRFGLRSRHTAWVGRGALAGVLAVQALLTLRLQNTAFDDEALYLYAGHLEIEAWTGAGPPHPEFVSYFSGSPYLYPPVAAALDSAFGLYGARALSLGLMLGATVLVYALARLLFDELAGIGAAALFATTQSTLFLGHLATYDATAVFLLALAAWLGVRGSRSARPAVGGLLLVVAATVLALGVAVKYATLLYVPSVVALTALCARGGRWREALRRALREAGTQEAERHGDENGVR